MTGIALVAVVVLVFGFVLMPLFKKKPEDAQDLKSTQKDLREREMHERILENLADLDDQLQMGKLDRSDYERLRREVEGEGTELNAVQTSVDVEATHRTTSQKRKSCIKCNAVNPYGNRFCKECGAKIGAE